MIDVPAVVEATPVRAAVIHFTIPRTEIQQAMGAGFGELISTLQAQGIAPAGAFFSHHFRVDATTFDFELGVPVATEVKPVGRVQYGELPGAKVIRTTYRGGYEGLGAAWGEFDQWIKANGLETAGDFWEVYAAGPESGPDPKTWRTELSRPLKA